jgi:2'-phosphotransferase
MGDSGHHQEQEQTPAKRAAGDASATRKPRRPRTKRAGRRDDPPEVRLSKTLAYALRHGAQELGLVMRSSGYVELRALLALPLFRGYTEAQVEEVVRTNSKKRFTLTTEEAGETAYIRANQGHTLQLVKDEDLLTPIEDAAELPMCIHGTYLKCWDSILEKGLSRMQRNHIHFTPRECVSESHEVVSGMRTDCNLLLYVDAARAIADGVKFYRSSNNVILSPGSEDTGALGRRYFVRAVKRDGAVVYEQPAQEEV